MNLLLAVLILAAGDADLITSHPQVDDVDPSSYIVGPGDVFWFTVPGGIPSQIAGTEEGTLLYLTVTPDGFLVVPSTGAWFVSGHSLEEAVRTVEAGFAARFPGLRGLAGLASLRVFRVPVTGQVGSPGIYDITGAHRLTDLLSKSGGISPAGSWTSVEVIHSDGDTSLYDISRFLLAGDIGSNPTLSMGDRIHVPQAQQFVRIEGAVHMSGLLSMEFLPEGLPAWTGSASGMLEYIPGETAAELVIRAGGTESWAVRDSCHVQRTADGGSVEFLPAPLDDTAIDPVLQPGDRVICPGIPPVVAVSGFVYSPGTYPHTGGMDAFFYISQAGGYLREASRSGTRIVLPDGTEEELDRVRDVPAGSSIVVPRKALVWWQDPLIIVTGIASVVIAWKSVFE